MSRFLIAANLLAAAVMACPQHDLSSESLVKRADGVLDWAYDASYDWGKVNDGKLPPLGFTSSYVIFESYCILKFLTL